MIEINLNKNKFLRTTIEWTRWDLDDPTPFTDGNVVHRLLDHVAHI